MDALLKEISIALSISHLVNIVYEYARDNLVIIGCCGMQSLPTNSVKFEKIESHLKTLQYSAEAFKDSYLIHDREQNAYVFMHKESCKYEYVFKNEDGTWSDNHYLNGHSLWTDTIMHAQIVYRTNLPFRIDSNGLLAEVMTFDMQKPKVNRMFAVLCAKGAYIFAFGGVAGNHFVQHTERYNLKENSWEIIGTCPNHISHRDTFVVCGKSTIYLFSMTRTIAHKEYMHIFNPETNAFVTIPWPDWSPKKCQEEVGIPCGIAFDQKIYLFNTPTHKPNVVNCVDNTWHTMTFACSGDHGHLPMIL